MERDGARVRPSPKLARFRAEAIGDGGVRVHKTECHEEKDAEDAPARLMKFPEDINVSDAFKPEVLGIEIGERHDVADGDDTTEPPQQVCLQFGGTAAVPVLPTIQENSPDERNDAEEAADEYL